MFSISRKSRRLECGALLVAAVLAMGAAANPASGTAPAPRAELEAILGPDREYTSRGLAGFQGQPIAIRANRAVRALERMGTGPAQREAARWLLEQYARGLTQDYYDAACTAVVHLAEAGRAGKLTASERQALAKLTEPPAQGCLASLATMALVDDNVRRLPEEEQIHAYREAFKDGWSGHAFLLVHRFEVPAPLLKRWQGGERFEKYGKVPFEGHAAQHYFRFRDRKFPSVQAEMEFLWARILDRYARSAKRAAPPEDDWTVYEFDEARAATARLIEIGPPTVPFLLAKQEFLLRAAHPQDPRSTSGDVYELWVMRSLLDPRFQPLLRRLASCGRPALEKAARDALARIERDDPYPYKTSWVLEIRPPVG